MWILYNISVLDAARMINGPKKLWTSFEDASLMTNELHAHLAVTANSLLVPAAAAASPSLSRSRGGATAAHLPLSPETVSAQGFLKSACSSVVS